MAFFFGVAVIVTPPFFLSFFLSPIAFFVTRLAPTAPLLGALIMGADDGGAGGGGGGGGGGGTLFDAAAACTVITAAAGDIDATSFRRASVSRRDAISASNELDLS